MPILISVFLFISLAHAECRFKDEVKKVSSLAGNVTVLIRELGLLSSPKLHGISIFNPISPHEFKGTVFPGGVFLSQKELPNFDGQVVFYDEVRDLHRLFSSRKNVISGQVKTRNLSPMEAIDIGLKHLSPYIVDCDQKISELKKRALKLEKEILEKVPENFKGIFYLGKMNSRYPETIMSNDGIVKWLRDKNKLTTYPSELAYVNWSAKIMNSLDENYLHVGVIDSGREGKKEVKREKNKASFAYPGSLVPGYSQLEAFHYFFSAI